LASLERRSGLAWYSKPPLQAMQTSHHPSQRVGGELAKFTCRLFMEFWNLGLLHKNTVFLSLFFVSLLVSFASSSNSFLKTFKIFLPFSVTSLFILSLISVTQFNIHLTERDVERKNPSHGTTADTLVIVSMTPKSRYMHASSVLISSSARTDLIFPVTAGSWEERICDR
jgi:hypothetical protein